MTSVFGSERSSLNEYEWWRLSWIFLAGHWWPDQTSVAVEQSVSSRHKPNDDCKSGWRIISAREPHSTTLDWVLNWQTQNNPSTKTCLVLGKWKKASKIIICCLVLQPTQKYFKNHQLEVELFVPRVCVCHQTRDTTDQSEAENLSFCHSRPSVRPIRRRLSICCHQRGQTPPTNQWRLEDTMCDTVTLYDIIWHRDTM